MRSLIFLSLTKLKGMVRNQFRSLGSGILTVFMVLLYGGLFVMVFASSSAYVPEAMGMQLNNALLMGIGCMALFCITVLMNKRKALVYDTDAFYLFAGPYSRKQINGFILLQTVAQSVLYSLLCCYITAMMSVGSHFTVPFFLMMFLAFYLVMGFFLMLTDYIYMWTLVKKHHKVWNYVAVLLVLGAAAGVFFLSVQSTGYDLKNGYIEFALGRKFFYVPFFGWIKWVLNAFLECDYRGMIPGSALLLFSNLVLAGLFLNFKKEIAEQAVEDAGEVSEYVRRVKGKKGNTFADTKKIKAIKGKFPEGAKAIFYKNMLQMRKTGNFLRKQDLFIIVLYFVISYLFMPSNRFYMFCYMMMIWLFNLMNDEDLMGDLKNYQIYLIPEHPLKKLVYAVIPTYFKIGIIVSTAILFAGVFMRMPALAIVQYIFMMLGYAMIFLAGTVLSMRILKSRSNIFMENLLRLLIVLACAVPSVVLGVLSFFIFRDFYQVMIVVSVVTLVMNFVVSGLIIVGCQGMMNGREM